MPSVLDQYVECILCAKSLTVERAFNTAHASWPDHLRIAFRCEACGHSNVLLIDNDLVMEGYLGDGVFAEFVVTREVTIPGLKVRPKATEIRIRNLNLLWKIPRE